MLFSEFVANATTACGTLDATNQCTLRVAPAAAQLDLLETCEDAKLLLATMGLQMAARFVRVLWKEWNDRNCAWNGV